jgi:orotidine-5'-phosphate decarboxylase
MSHLIEADRSLIVALDVPGLLASRVVVGATSSIEKVSAYKIGFLLACQGLGEVVRDIRETIEKNNGNRGIKLVYDHQKAGNDIPDMGAPFAKMMRLAGIDSVILFPFAGPSTQEAWTKACQDEGLHVMIGSVMTHERFLASEGGYIADDAPAHIIDRALCQGIQDFVVPGKKLEWVKYIKSLLGDTDHTLYAPGFVTQGGDISECGKAAGKKFHAIVGREIYTKPTPSAMNETAHLLASKL